MTDFTGARFSGDKTSFFKAHFSEGVSFINAQFSSSLETSFTYAQFSEASSFTGARFSSDETSFSVAKFSEGASFSGAQFSSSLETSFTYAQFGSSLETSFSGAQFSGARTNFRAAQFTGHLDFDGTEFGSADTSFKDVTFTKELDFSGTTFKDKVAFSGTTGNLVFASQAGAWFGGSRIDKPEMLIFNTVLLHPCWFCNTDVRKVDFTNVKWYGMPGGPGGTLVEEIHALEDRGVESPHTMLAQACRRLSANAEENHEYPLANEFHYWSMDALRIGRWRYLRWLKGFIKKNWRRIGTRFGLLTTLLWIWRILRRKPFRYTMPSRFGLITTLYWALSGYGVRAARAFWLLIALCAAFAALYVLFGPDALRVSSASNFGQAMQHVGQATVYSMSTMARLNPEPKPGPGFFQLLVTIEGILGPLQIALLVLAIRRKVMR